MGELWKASKATLLHFLEKDVIPEASIEGQTVTILDGMALVQKLKTPGKTFGDLSQDLVDVVLYLGRDSSRIDLVFNVYSDESIKNAERTRCTSGSFTYQILKSTQPVKQWTNFLSSSENKGELIKFFISSWTAKPINVSLKMLFVGY